MFNGKPQIPILVHHPIREKGLDAETAIRDTTSPLGVKVITCSKSEDIAAFDQQSLPVILVLPFHKETRALITRKNLCNVRGILWDEAEQTSLVVRTEFTICGIRSIATGNIGKLVVAVQQQVAEARREIENRSELLAFGIGSGLIGQSRPWLRVLDDIAAVATHRDEPVLIYGQTGTGKELVANAIHEKSLVRGPIKYAHCAYLNGPLARSELFGHVPGAFTDGRKEHRGLIEEAKGGTVLLDDVQLLDGKTQGELLRTLQERTILPVGSANEIDVSDVRFIFATNIDLLSAIKDGEFREDLYYRLNVVQLNLPALQDRDGDIELLANHFLQKYSSKYGSKVTSFSHEVLSIFQLLPWKGNVRQLENAIISAVIRKRNDRTRIELADLPVDVFQGLINNEAPALDDSVQDSRVLVVSQLASMDQLYRKVERWALQRTLEETNGNQSQAAKILGITRGKIRDRLHEFSISIGGKIVHADNNS